MKKSIFAVTLAVSFMFNSFLSFAAETEVYQNKEINVNIDKTKDTPKEENKEKESLQTEETTTAGNAEYESESTTAQLIETKETLNDEIFTKEKTEESTKEISTEATEAEIVTEIETTEEISSQNKEETIESNVNIDITNQNVVNVIDNKGTVNVFIQNIIQADVDAKENEEPDVNIYNENAICLDGTEDDKKDMTFEEKTTKEAITEEYTNKETEETITENTTETTSNKTSSNKKNRSISKSSGNGKSSYTAAKTSEKTKTQDKKEKSMQAERLASTQNKKKSAVLTIGSNIINCDGKSYATDAAPYISQKSYTLVPLRSVSELFQAKIEWEGETKTIYITTEEEKKICLKINSDIMIENNASKLIPQSPEISESRTYVPLRVISEALGAEVEWIGETKSIIITK